MTAVDVGANVGTLSLVMARVVGPTGQVIAIEPGPESLRWLRRNIARNRAANVTVMKTAVGALQGRRAFYAEDTLVHGSFYDHPDAGRRWTVDVEQKTLDQLVPDGADLVKIDVEGAELEVLQGAPRLLASGPRLVVEWNPATLIAAGHSPSALLSTLLELGYHPSVINDRPSDLTSTATLKELAERADARTLPPNFYVNLACERR
jgi:FkbM family methyltransferase